MLLCSHEDRIFTSPFLMQMREVQGWRVHTVKAAENRAAERAVDTLTALAGTNVHRFYGPQRVGAQPELKSNSASGA